MLRRLRTRIIFSFCLLMVGGGALSTTLVSRNMSRSLEAVVDRSGLSLARVLAGQLLEPLAYGDRLVVHDLLAGVHDLNPDVVYAFIATPDGRVRDHSFAAGGFPPDLLEVVGLAGPLTLGTEVGPVRDLAVPITEGAYGTLHLGLSMAWVEAATDDAVGNVLLTTLLALAAGILGIFFLASLITRPLLALRNAAVRLGAGDPGARAVVKGSDEIADLARTFNRMAAQIQGRIAESEALRAYMERVLDQMTSAIFVVSNSMRVEYANRVTVELHGSLAGRVCSEVMRDHRPCEECPAREVLDSGQVVHRRYSAGDGRTYELKWVPIVGRDGGPAVVERALDITERLRMQEEYERAQRLAVAGEVAAGVVHSVNNPLDGVRRALEIAESHADEPLRVRRMLSLAREGTDRIAAVTRSLLGFARAEPARQPTAVEVSWLVEAAVGLARLKAEANQVEIEVEGNGGRARVAGDPQGLEEALVNLLLNAVDACRGGGRVVIRSEARGPWVQISVSDSGPGIEETVGEKVFEPFFTTKPAGEGTGLGLSVARKAVEAHQGTLRLRRAREGGAEFVMRLPRSEEGEGTPMGESYAAEADRGG